MKDQSKTKQELIQELSSLRQKVSEIERLESVFRKAEMRLSAVNECLLSLSNDVGDNIRRLTALAGELMCATASIYNRLEGDMLVAVGQWQTPTDFKTKDRAHGHICYDVIRRNEERIVHIRNLADTPYAETDPNVCVYGLATYIGHVVRRGLEPMGSLCVVFQRDFIPTADDERLLGILASSLGAEEKRGLNENALRESEERYRTVLDEMEEGYQEVDLAGNFTFFNEAFLKIFGYSAEEMMGKNYSLYAAEPEIAKEVYRAYNRMYSTGIPLKNFEWDIIRKDGARRTIEFFASLLRDSNGHPIGFRGIVRDINDHRRVEAALRESEKRYRELTDFLPISIYEIDAAGSIVSLNQNTLEVFRYNKEDYKEGMSALKFFPPEEWQRVRENIGKVIQGESGPGREYTFLRKDGSTFIGLAYSSPSIHENNTVGIRGAIIDITERKRADTELRKAYEQLRAADEQMQAQYNSLVESEQSLRESEERYRYLVKHAPTGIYEVDVTSRKFLSVNDIMCQYTGYTREEFLAMDSIQLLTEESMKTFMQRHPKVLAGEPFPDSVEYQIKRKNGSQFWALLNSRHSYEPDNRIIATVIAHDITDRKRVEEALLHSEEQYRTLIETSRDLIYTTNIKGFLTYINPTLQGTLGYAHHEWNGKSFAEIVAPEYIDSVRDIFRKAMKGKSIPVYEAALIRKDGSRLSVEFNVVTMYDRDGNPSGRYGIGRDVTDRKRAEEALREGEHRLHSIIDGSPIPAFVIGKDHRVIYWNKALEEISRIKPWEVVGTCEHWKAFYNEERLCMADLLVDGAVESVPQWYSGKYTKSPLIEDAYEVTDFFPALGKDGKWLRFTAAAIRDSERMIVAAVETLEDITERKRTEEALKKAETRYRIIFENALEGIYQSTPDGRFLQVNPAMSRIYGYDSPDDMEHSVTDIAKQVYVNQDDRKYLKETLEKNDHIEKYEYQVRKKSGEIICVSNNARAVRDNDGKILYYEGLVQDITDRKRAEDQRRAMEERLQRAEKMEALGTLAGGVAHDLNNVLGVLVGYSELLLQKVPQESPFQRHAMQIFKGGQRAAAIIQDLLTLTRRGVMVSEALNLNTVISDFLQMPEFEAIRSHHPSVQFKTSLDAELLNIKGSSTHLNKMVMNLLSNAAEAISGSGEVLIRTENRYVDRPIHGYDTTKEGEYAVLTVSDTGSGISRADIEKIFEPFYTKKVMGRSGTGLGLAVVWGTVKDHDGYIDVQSTEGEGSIFTLYFPVTREDITKAEQVVPQSTYLGRGEHILVVDDVEGQRLLASAMLDSLGYKVSSVASGEEAIDFVRKQPVDLLILDMIMDPGIDGLETYRRILEIRKDQKAIIVSGFSETDRVHAAQSLGAGAYVRKPYIVEKLGLSVKKELDGK